MLGVDARAARVAWTVFLVALCVLVVYKIRGALLSFTIALLLAYLLSPLVDLLGRVTPGKLPRTLSLAAVYALLLVALVATGATVGSQIVSEAALLAGRVPDWLRNVDISKWPAPAWLEPWKEQAIDALRAELEAGAKEIVPLLQEVGQRAAAVIGRAGFLVLVPVLSFLFLKDARAIREAIIERIASGPRRSLVEDILSDVHRLLGQFMRALVILAAATFVFYGLFFWITGVPYAALMAGLAGVAEFIPFVGPLSAAAVILLVVILAGKFTLAIWTLVFLLVYRMFQDYVLQPYLMSAGVALHPAWVIFGILAGEQLAGVSGMFLSIPVLATLRVIAVRIGKARETPSAL